MIESPASAPAMVEPPPSLAELPVPRRVAIATLFRAAWRAARELAALYAASARRASIAPLRTALETLATLEREHASALAALAPVLDPEGGEGGAALEPTAMREAVPEQRADLFARAFDLERTLEVAYREIDALLGDPARCPALRPLAAQAVRHRALLRDLYLRYS